MMISYQQQSLEVNPSDSIRQKQIEEILRENQQLKEQITRMAETINSLKQSKCSDNALIQENTIQKNKITSLKKQVFIQNQKLQELKETLKEYKDDYQNLLNLQATFVSSWKDVEMKRRAGILKTDRSEEETERNPYTYLHDYHSSSELSSMQSFEGRDSSFYTIFTKCKVIGCRMINTICDCIPEWREKTETIEKIKTSLPCMLENTERVLVELLNQRQENEKERLLYMTIAEDNKQLKERMEQQQALYLLIEEIFCRTARRTPTQSYRDQLQSINSSVKQLLAESNSDSIIDLTRKIRDYKERPEKHDESNSSVIDDSSINLFRTILTYYIQQIDAKVDALNTAMNKVSTVINMNIAGEQDVTHYNEKLIQAMSDYDFVRYCKRQDLLLQTRIDDFIHIVNYTLNLLKTQQQSLCSSQKRASYLFDQYHIAVQKLDERDKLVGSLKDEIKELKSFVDSSQDLLNTSLHSVSTLSSNTPDNSLCLWKDPSVKVNQASY